MESAQTATTTYGYADEDELEVIDLKEAARILCVSYPTVLRLAQRHEIKAFRVGTAWRTTREVCIEFVRVRMEA